MEDLAQEILRISTNHANEICLVTHAWPMDDVTDVEEGVRFLSRRVRRGEAVAVYHLEQTTFTRVDAGITMHTPYVHLATFRTCSIAVRTMVTGIPRNISTMLTLQVNGTDVADFSSVRQAVLTMRDIL